MSGGSGNYVKGALALGWVGGEAPVESMGTFATVVSTGANVPAYQGIVGAAPRTLIRLCEFISAVSSVTPTFTIYRTITGQAAIAQQLFSVNVTSGVVQATSIQATSNAGLGATTTFNLQQPTAALGIGSTSVLAAVTNYPIYLFPGDALVVSGVNTAAAAQFRTWWAIAEYPA